MRAGQVMTERDDTGAPTEGYLRARYLAGVQDGRTEERRRWVMLIRALLASPLITPAERVTLNILVKGTEET